MSKGVGDFSMNNYMKKNVSSNDIVPQMPWPDGDKYDKLSLREKSLKFEEW